MPRYKAEIRDQVFGARHRQRPRSFSSATCIPIQIDKDCDDAQKHKDERDIRSLPAIEEDVVLRELWTDRYLAGVLGKHGNEATTGE